ncbi:MAG: hypothetical protein ACKN9T_00355 [Candidatus Methylumidiphilus sp.]
MKWPFSQLFGNTKSIGDEALIERYKAHRVASRELHTDLAKQLPKPAVQECGKKIGIFKAGTLILNNDDEIGILFDYALHHYYRAGKNTIQRYFDNTQPPDGSMDKTLMRALLESWYSVFRVVDVHPRQGVSLLDLVSGKTFDLVDLGLGDTATLGGILVGRILPVADFNMSSGTFVPVSEAVFEDHIKPILRKFLKSDQTGIAPRLSTGQMAAYVGEIIRVALHAGGSDNMFYSDVEA